ncbi:hypothetical protein [Streptococcus suis]
MTDYAQTYIITSKGKEAIEMKVLKNSIAVEKMNQGEVIRN